MELDGRLIPLTQGYWTIVDEDDYNWLSRWRWKILIAKGYPQWHFSAVRTITGGGTAYMHREILGLSSRRDEVDHINGYSLDNRRSNLRLATKSQNQGNRYRILARSGFRGVRFDKKTGLWQGRVCINYRHLHLGSFVTAAEAARAVDAALVEQFGAFARTNESLGRFSR